ncbi:MAG TPA: hypothetical protein QGH71_07005, partial [Candidatus Marinimicrobia bacterium]|nr:hypothetical protein [Candidatus Neomarinimicrobiota bacterium]
NWNITKDEDETGSLVSTWEMTNQLVKQLEIIGTKRVALFKNSQKINKNLIETPLAQIASSRGVLVSRPPN